MLFFIIVMVISFILSLYRIYASTEINQILISPPRFDRNLTTVEAAMLFFSGFVPVSVIETPIRILTRDEYDLYELYSIFGTVITSFIYAIFSGIAIMCYRQIKAEAQPQFIAAAWKLLMMKCEMKNSTLLLLPLLLALLIRTCFNSIAK